MLVARPVRAEPWLRTLADELRDASVVELAVVERVDGLTVHARVADAMRSPRRVGDAVVYDLGDKGLHKPAAGDRVLAVCDAGACPRVLGVQRGGVYLLEAADMYSGWAAWIAPAAVTDAALRDLLAGYPPAPLCVRGTVDLLDEAASVAVELRLDAGTGRGRGSVGAVAVTSAWTTRAAVEMFGDGAFVRIGDDAHGAMLYTDRVRVDGGCIVGDFWWGWPSAIPRTQAGLAEVLAGTFGAHAIATGTLRVPAGAPIAAGRHALRFELDAAGEVQVVSPVASGPITMARSAYGLGVARGRPSFGVEVRDAAGAVVGELRFVFDVTGGNAVRHTAAQLVEYVAARGRATVDVQWVPLPLPASGPPTVIELGRVTLRYVPERGRGRPPWVRPVSPPPRGPLELPRGAAASPTIAR